MGVKQIDYEEDRDKESIFLGNISFCDPVFDAVVLIEEIEQSSVDFGYDLHELVDSSITTDWDYYNYAHAVFNSWRNKKRKFERYLRRHGMTFGEFSSYLQRKLQDIKCEACGKIFRPSHSTVRFCSVKCSRSRFVLPPKNCLICGTEFKTSKRFQEYCSKICARKKKRYK